MNSSVRSAASLAEVITYLVVCKEERDKMPYVSLRLLQYVYELLGKHLSPEWRWFYMRLSQGFVSSKLRLSGLHGLGSETACYQMLTSALSLASLQTHSKLSTSSSMRLSSARS